MVITLERGIGRSSNIGARSSTFSPRGEGGSMIRRPLVTFSSPRIFDTGANPIAFRATNIKENRTRGGNFSMGSTSFDKRVPASMDVFSLPKLSIASPTERLADRRVTGRLSDFTTVIKRTEMNSRFVSSQLEKPIVPARSMRQSPDTIRKSEGTMSFLFTPEKQKSRMNVSFPRINTAGTVLQRSNEQVTRERGVLSVSPFHQVRFNQEQPKQMPAIKASVFEQGKPFFMQRDARSVVSPFQVELQKQSGREVFLPQVRNGGSTEFIVHQESAQIGREQKSRISLIREQLQAIEQPKTIVTQMSKVAIQPLLDRSILQRGKAISSESSADGLQKLAKKQIGRKQEEKEEEAKGLVLKNRLLQLFRLRQMRRHAIVHDEETNTVRVDMIMQVIDRLKLRNIQFNGAHVITHLPKYAPPWATSLFLFQIPWFHRLRDGSYTEMIRFFSLLSSRFVPKERTEVHRISKMFTAIKRSREMIGTLATPFEIQRVVQQEPQAA